MALKKVLHEGKVLKDAITTTLNHYVGSKY